MPAPIAGPAIAFGTGTTIGTTANLINPDGLGRRLLAYVFSDGNGGSVMIPVETMQMMPMGGGLQVMDPILQESQAKPKKRRKRSKYQMEFGRSMKALKRKHPRTPTNRLMKRAHTMTKKKMRRR